MEIKCFTWLVCEIRKGNQIFRPGQVPYVLKQLQIIHLAKTKKKQFKHAVQNYTERSAPMYACFLDLSKAFDYVVVFCSGMLTRKTVLGGLIATLSRTAWSVE